MSLTSWHRVFLGISAIIIFIAIVLNGMRLLVVVLADHRNFIEKWASQAIHKPVHIGGVRADWNGFEPEITFKNVEVSKWKNKQSFIRIQQLSIKIDIFHSLLQWKLLPGRLTIKGTDLEFYQTKNNQFRVSGILTGKEQSQFSAHSAAFKDLLRWVLTEANVVVENVNINWHASNGVTYPIRRLRLRVRNDSSTHHIVGALSFKQSSAPMHIRFNANLRNVDLLKLQCNANIYLQAKHLDLKQWFNTPWIRPYLSPSALRVKEGIVDVKAWVTWRQSHLQSLQSTIDAKAVKMLLPKFYTHLLTVDRLQLTANWKQGASDIYIPHYFIKTDALMSRGKLRLTMSKSDPAIIDSLSNFHFDDLTKLREYLPDRYLSKKRYAQLAGLFKKGQLTNGTVLLRGPVFEADMHFKDMVLNYHKGWPAVEALDATLRFKDHGMQGNFQHAVIAGSPVQHLQASIADIEHPVVKISGQVDSNFTKALSIFQQMPLQFGKLLKTVSLTGPFNLDLNVTIPFQGKPAAVSYRGKLQVKDAILSLPKSKLRLNHINGYVLFNNTNVRSQALSAELFGSPMQITLLTSRDKQNAVVTRVLLEGHLNVEKLRHNFVLPKLNGGQLKIENRPLRIQLTYQKNVPIKIMMNYNHEVSVAMLMNHDLKLFSGELYLGEGHARFQDLPGFVIDGRLASIDWSQWKRVVLPFIKKKDAAIILPKVLGLPLRYIEFHVTAPAIGPPTIPTISGKLEVTYGDTDTCKS